MARITVTRILLLLFLLAPAARAAVPVTEPEIHLDNSARYVEDLHQQWTIEQILSLQTGWIPNGETAFNMGYQRSPWWLHVTLTNPASEPAQRLLEVGYAALDHVDIYVVENGAVRTEFQLGDKLPYSRRPMDHRFFLVPVTFAPGQTLDIYLRVQSSGALQVPLTLWEYSRFHSADFVSTVVQGIYFGGILTIALYNLLIFFVLGDRNYLFYVLFMTSTMMAMAAQQGFAFRFLWPNATHWNDQAIIFFTSCTGLFAILFTLRFLRVKQFAPLVARLLQLGIVTSFITMVMVFVLDYQANAKLTLINLIIVVTLAVVTGIIAFVRRVPSARIYLLAWTILLVGAAVVSMSRLGWVPANAVTEYSAQIGSLLEGILLSLALANRINTERRLRFLAQAEALQASQLANAELEARVQSRTAELEQLNQRLQQLSETDQLTGLANRRFLEQRLQQEWARAQRSGDAVAFLLIDVDHFKQVNDRYGHPVGDQCLKQVAEVLSSGLRVASDVAARYGGEEFSLLLPQTDISGAQVVAERIRQQVEACELDANGAPFKVTISVGVCAANPGVNNTIAQLIKQADDALYQSKQSGRNRVTAARL